MSIKDYYETFKIEVCHNIDADRPKDKFESVRRKYIDI